MKLSYSAALISALMVSSIMAVPVTESSSSSVVLPVASITITNTTTTTLPAPSQTPVIPVAEALSGANATASIYIIGQNVTAQSSGSERTFVGAASIALPAAIISAILLV